MELYDDLTLLSEEFNREVLAKVASDQLPSDELDAIARLYLTQLEKSERDSKTPILIPKTDLRVHPLLEAFLLFASSDHGRRYAACAIFACKRQEDAEVIIPNLQKLASDWFRFFLVPCEQFIFISALTI
jgi:hypothetical protein